jgi:hypothetical protein
MWSGNNNNNNNSNNITTIIMMMMMMMIRQCLFSSSFEDMFTLFRRPHLRFYLMHNRMQTIKIRNFYIRQRVTSVGSLSEVHSQARLKFFGRFYVLFTHERAALI